MDWYGFAGSAVFGLLQGDESVLQIDIAKGEAHEFAAPDAGKAEDVVCQAEIVFG